MSRLAIGGVEPDDQREQAGFAAGRARLADRLGSRRLNATVWVLPCGEALGPYHYHLVEEELLLVLDGAPRLRTTAGWEQLAPGDLVSFAAGPEGAHQLANPGDRPARLLFVSTRDDVDAVVYPDTERVGVIARQGEPGGVRGFFRLADDTGFWNGETPPTG
jgi:uncharacterized cupin superfamily protein